MGTLVLSFQKEVGKGGGITTRFFFVQFLPIDSRVLVHFACSSNLSRDDDERHGV